MDSQRAREILLLFRPGVSDADDPEFREALELVKRDPELRRWFDEHCARQSLIRDRLKKIAVPGELKKRILDDIAAREAIVWWQQPAFRVLAAAAAIVLLIGLVYFWPRPDTSLSFAAYQRNMVGNIQRIYPTMDMVTTNVAGILQYLTQKQGHADYVLPQPLQRLPGIGCAILPWRSKKVSLICLDAGQQSELYVFVINRADLPDPPPIDRPQFNRIGRLTSASWSHADKTYILAGPGDAEFIKRYL
jgi:uncharacterized membrane protein YbaN (DUF454 family)